MNTLQRKKPTIVVLSGLLAAALLPFAWRALPIEGETRIAFFAKGRIPREIAGILDIGCLSFVSFSKNSDEVTTLYVTTFRKKPDYDDKLLNKELGRSGWWFSHERSFSGDRTRYYCKTDMNDSSDLLVTLEKDGLRFSYFVSLNDW